MNIHPAPSTTRTPSHSAISFCASCGHEPCPAFGRYRDPLSGCYASPLSP